MRGLCVCRATRRPRSDGHCCVHIGHDEPIATPDLATYSQAEEMALGRHPRWDSPDIITNAWGPFRLLPEAKVNVRNISPTVSAVNVLVHFYSTPFGIGMPRTLLQTRKLSISPTEEVQLTFPLDSATLSGDPRVGVVVALEHPYDANKINNHGEQIHQGSFTSEAGRLINATLPVLNSETVSQTLSFELLPTDLPTVISPVVRTLAPGEQVVLSLRISVPTSLSGSTGYIEKSVTVIAKRTDGSLFGGATYVVRVND